MTSDPPRSQPDDESTPSEDAAPAVDESSEESRQRARRIKIGSQRPDDQAGRPQIQYVVDGAPLQPPLPAAPAPEPPEASAPAVEPETPVAPEPAVDSPNPTPTAEEQELAEADLPGPIADVEFPPPRLTDIGEELQREIDDALNGVQLDTLMAPGEAVAAGDEIELDNRYTAAVMKIHHEDVFFSLPGRHQGVASLRQFPEVPEVGQTIEVVPVRFDPDEGLYELTVPGASVSVADWSDLTEGIHVEVLVTGHNKGGLECEVHHIRGFIPASQVSLYHVDDLEECVGQKLTCLVTEANPGRRNLVLSRRAVLEHEREEARQKMLEELEVGQVVEGVVRNIREFGAFVDLGGVDGLVHVSKMSWDRVEDPKQVFTEGDKVQVKVERIDRTTGKISLSHRDVFDNPWTHAAANYPAGAIVTGTVSKIMDFGAFVRLEAGIEGLVHLSELSHGRVFKVANFVNEGEEITVKVLSVDAESQRMSLSLKAVQAAADPKPAKQEAETEEDEPPRPLAVPKRNTPLKGGTNRRTGGDQFGLDW